MTCGRGLQRASSTKWPTRPDRCRGAFAHLEPAPRGLPALETYRSGYALANLAGCSRLARGEDLVDAGEEEGSAGGGALRGVRQVGSAAPGSTGPARQVVACRARGAGHVTRRLAAVTPVGEFPWRHARTRRQRSPRPRWRSLGVSLMVQREVVNASSWINAPGLVGDADHVDPDLVGHPSVPALQIQGT
jgi:hypothetical protein